MTDPEEAKARELPDDDLDIAQGGAVVAHEVAHIDRGLTTGKSSSARPGRGGNVILQIDEADGLKSDAADGQRFASTAGGSPNV
ncbi:MAG: hypothetical protein AAF674_02135 [Pseudomonadota bacterium]